MVTEAAPVGTVQLYTRFTDWERSIENAEEIVLAVFTFTPFQVTQYVTPPLVCAGLTELEGCAFEGTGTLMRRAATTIAARAADSPT
jgi:hypothetical protein